MGERGSEREGERERAWRRTGRCVGWKSFGRGTEGRGVKGSEGE